MSTSLAVAFLPARCTSWARGIVQPLAWLQCGASGAAREVRALATDLHEPGISGAEARQLREALAELRRQVGHQSALLDELERQLAVVSGLKDQLRDPTARIRIAQVIAYDPTPPGQTLKIGRGSRDGIRVDQWVVAGEAAESRRAEASGRELVSQQWLIGRIVETQPYLSRVQLASDPRFGPVRVGMARERADGTWDAAAREALLSGAGRGRLVIDRAVADFLATGETLVLVQPSGGLPAPLAIGRIVASRRIPEAPLYFDLEVRPLGDYRALDYVYVISHGE